MRRKSPSIGVVIAAGGSGKRFGGRTPKQLAGLSGRPVLEHTLRLFHRFPGVSQLIVVVPRSNLERVQRMIRGARINPIPYVVAGGSNRQRSVFKGLQAFSPTPELVIVHDAVRPLAERRVLRDVIKEARKHRAAVPALPVTDTVKKEGKRGFLVKTIDRSELWSVQTPQCFDFDLLLRAHRKALRKGETLTDDAALVEKIGVPVKVVAGSVTNIKITGKRDVLLAEMLLKRKGS